MRVRLISDNLLDNTDFDLQVDNEYPVGWFIDNNTSTMIGNEWKVDSINTTLYHPQKIEKVDLKDSFYNFVTIKKSATVRGEGYWKNIPTVTHTLNLNNQTFIDELPSPYVTTESRWFETNDINSYVIANDIKTYMELETNMLRVPNYSDNKGKSIKVSYTPTGREITSTRLYQPVSTNISFLTCIDEASAIDTFFKTCAKYRKGVTVQAFLTPSSGQEWGTFEWSNTVWSGIPAEGDWYDVFHIDLNGYRFNPSSVTGGCEVSCLIQKTELRGVDVVGTYTE